MQHFGHTLRATYVSAPIDRQGIPETIPPKSEEKNPKIWESPFPEEFCSEKLLSWKPKMEDPALKPNKNRPVCKKIDVDLIGHNAQVNSLDAFLVPKTYRCVRNPLHVRYTQSEWLSWNNSADSTAGTMCDEARRIMKTGTENRKENQKKIDKAEADSRKELSDRILEVYLKRNEILNEKKALMDEIEELTKLNNLVDEMLTKLETTLSISEHCLFERDKRQSIDLAHDVVEKALVCEVDTIKLCQRKFQDSAERILAQQSSNRSALHEIEMDTMDMESALNLDETALQTSKTDPAIIASGFKNIQIIENSVTDPKTWLESATATIERCQNQRTPSKTLRDLLDTSINDTCTKVLQCWNATNSALDERINETLNARTKLAGQLDCINHQIYNMHGNIEDIRRSMDDKHATYQRNQKSLDLRYRRPNVEACRDKAQEKLLEESSVVNEVVEDLKNEMYTSGDHLQLLQRMKTSLEEDVAIKNNTLFIDREKVRPLRKTFPLAPLCGIRVKMEHNIFNSIS